MGFEFDTLVSSDTANAEYAEIFQRDFALEQLLRTMLNQFIGVYRQAGWPENQIADVLVELIRPALPSAQIIQMRKRN